MGHRDKTDGELERLERDLGERLRGLPAVEPDPAFRERLRGRLAAEHAAPANGRRRGGRRTGGAFTPFRAAIVAAACLLLVFAGWFRFLGSDEMGEPVPGALFLAQAQAGMGVQLGEFALTPGGLDTLRQVRFEIGGRLPKAPSQGRVWRLKQAKMTAAEALALAVRMGIEHPRLPDGWESSTGASVSCSAGGDQRLLIWPLGTWLYEDYPARGDETQPSPPPAKTVTHEQARAAALEWLERAGLLPEEGTYDVEQRDYEVTLRRAATPDGLPVAGDELRITVALTTDGKVYTAYGNWYPVEDSFAAGLIGYEEALERLRRGEGLFEAHGGFNPGVAVIGTVEPAYRLAFALDHTPYLVPVAVFRGEFTPDQGEPRPFAAYVSLLEYRTGPNAGNFVLDAALPEVPERARGLRERLLAATEAELPALASFFGLTGAPGDDGVIRGPRGEELGPTSWDGGWIYRGPEASTHARDTARVDVPALVEAARTLVAGLPALPGEPGEPQLVESGTGEWAGVRIPLLYGGLPVVKPDDRSYLSHLWVWQFGTDREVWTVKCSHPMEFTGEEIPLITPGEAWEKLLGNESVVYVDAFFGAIPGARFAVPQSRVTDVKLVYLPRHPQLVRNAQYDLMYQFAGEAQVGSRRIEFAAYVEARKPAS
ncbi:hypothetical protein [Candidatus Desulforudis audaxviator]|uniref:Uncharacterized protein n=1 Tax=Desulforudis audaxviator (strain MP104C) TaxID=477974 RepID=B1I1D3_DESAP|nr:hypothetical protein [Candidatus Desulforudis audaxviator]ACA58905.1 hypothetical protein Daud_0347 [Candidatus Desulforudis audaxviator MP104C]AZK58924.1 hypothetical protein Daudx_0369 [Candidatus Desulforudis audaxviator]